MLIVVEVVDGEAEVESGVAVVFAANFMDWSRRGSV